MKRIATLTMNPTIDVSYEVDRVRHTHKMRTEQQRYAPGGGGINVARMLVRLGSPTNCHYLSGGATGPALDEMLAELELPCTRLPITGPTRIASSVFEHGTGKEYRFVPNGPELSEAEWRQCLALLGASPCAMMVLSGSLPRGVPADFYARIARMMAQRGVPVVLDSSGDALRAGIAGGDILLAKPSLGELRQLVGRHVESIDEIAEAAMAIVEAGQCRMLAVTMGHNGAILASADGPVHMPALPVEARSAVGAGDCFVAGMVHALAQGDAPRDAFRLGMAAGAAAVLTPGTDLAYPEDIERLFASS
jgi:6-phosphofructokinase 2